MTSNIVRRSFATRSSIAAWLFVWVSSSIASIGHCQIPTAEIRLLSNQTISGAITGVDVDQILLDSSNGSQAISFADIEKVEFLESGERPSKKAIRVDAIDGSTYFASTCEIGNQTLSAQLICGTKLTLAKRNVLSIRFANQSDAKKLDGHLTSVLKDPTITADTLIVYRNNEFNAIEGIVNSVTGDSVSFSIDEQTANVAIKKISAISFFKAGFANGTSMSFSEPTAVCHLSDGSSSKVRQIAFDGKRLNCKTITGDSFDVGLLDLSSIVFNESTTVFLSDLKPSTNDWAPLLASESIVDQLRWLRTARINQDFNDAPLTLEVARPSHEIDAGKTPLTLQTFERGFALKGGSRLAWNLAGNYQSFEGLVGFSPNSNRLGNVTFRVLLDGRNAKSITLDRSTNVLPRQFELDLLGVERMIIEVDYADGRAVGDTVHLVKAVLQR